MIEYAAYKGDRFIATGTKQQLADMLNKKVQTIEHHMLVDKHITHGIARSAEDALKIINERLCGYGFKDYEQ